MKMLFVHDSPFIEHEGECRSAGNITATTWRRFLPHVDHIQVVARRADPAHVKDPSKLNSVSHPDVSFDLVERSPYHRFERGWREVMPILDKHVRQADVVVARIPSFIGHLTAEIALKQNKPLAGEIVACPWDAMWNYGRLSGKAMAIRERLRLRRLVKRLDFAVYVTGEFLQKRYPTNAPHESASNVELLRPPETLLDDRLARQTQTPNPLRLGQIGSLAHRIKGWETAIRAVARLKAQGVDVVFEILGGGDPAVAMQCAKENGVEDRVHALGTIAGGEPVLSWLDSLDMYIHPSRQEGLPRSVIEAMSRALPCICTPAGGTPELIDPRYIFAKNDDTQLADSITTLLNDPAQMHEQSRKNFARAADFYIDHLEAHRDKIWGDYFASVRKRIAKAR
ncbi:glycosyltransferase [Phycisphaeraceae bacterium D3-23]